MQLSAVFVTSNEEHATVKINSIDNKIKKLSNFINICFNIIFFLIIKKYGKKRL